MNRAFRPLELALQAPPPWLRPLQPLALPVLHATRSQPLAAALNALAATVVPTVHFVEQSMLPQGEAYEAFIHRTGCVPTRENLHDCFNGLMWLSYPQTKRRLNALQAEEIARHGTAGVRGALRDALTVFDENAAILRAPGALTDALRRRDWRALFIEQRALWQQATLVLFGHALLEKLLQPRKPITAHVWVVDELGDAALAGSLTPERLTTKPFLPLPVLGVPGWWPANEEAGFYDDAAVFRPGVG